MTQSIEAAVLEALRRVIDPELNENIVDLGLVYDVQVHADGRVVVVMTLTTPDCPRAGEIVDAVQAAVTAAGASAADVHVTSDPPWSPYRMASRLRVPLGLPEEEPPPPAAPASRLGRWLRQLRGAGAQHTLS